VIEPISGRYIVCPECKKEYQVPDGWYGINKIGSIGLRLAVSYTLLSRLDP